MRRHPALVPLSHDHHHELVRARSLRRAAAAAEEERLAAAETFLEFFGSETLRHFRDEEESLFPLLGLDHPEVVRALREHAEIHGEVRRLRALVAGGEVAPEALEGLGRLVETHVRWEERELFELIQEAVPAPRLEALALPERPG
ncbi:MAG TPA: hemerythrin domain-containing protein [Gaiellaceae bacterium]|nr:hemerythrin domain-containing protein [Gaiellaceae bacterium]